ncbi:MAG: hypothetical protein ACRYGF_12380 [Janthinobacterium lividum]
MACGIREYGLLIFVLVAAQLAFAQQPIPVQTIAPTPNGTPASGGYDPPKLALVQLMASDQVLNGAMMTLMRSGDRGAIKAAVLKASQEGKVAAQLLLAEQYIPEQCSSEPNQDAPHCGESGNEPPKVVFRGNLLNVDASYEEAARWLEKASAQGSGEASEIWPSSSHVC